MRVLSKDKAELENTRYSSPPIAMLPSSGFWNKTLAFIFSVGWKRLLAQSSIVSYICSFVIAGVTISVENVTFPFLSVIAPSRYFSSVCAWTRNGRQRNNNDIKFFIIVCI